MDVDCSLERYTTLIDFIGHYGVDNTETAAEISTTPDYDVTVPLTHRQAGGHLSKLRLSAFQDDTRYGTIYEDKVQYGEGSAYILFDGDYICFEHDQMGVPVGLGLRTAVHRTLRMFAANPEILRSFVCAVVAWEKRIEDLNRVEIDDGVGKYRLYTLRVQSEYAIWEPHGLQESRSLKSIILPDEQLVPKPPKSGIANMGCPIAAAIFSMDHQVQEKRPR